MRKFILISIAMVFVIAISFFAHGIVSKTRGKVKIEEQIARLPSFSFITLENASYYSDSIKKGPVLIVRFHPECEHCKFEISEIMNSKIPASGIKILLVSGAGREDVIRFLDQFNITEKQGVMPLLDTAFIFGDIFGKDVVPSNYIYNKELKLVKILYGEYKTETILKYLEQGE